MLKRTLVFKKRVLVSISPFFIFAATLHAGDQHQTALVQPKITSMSPPQLRVELFRSLAGAVGNCAVSYNIVALTAVSDAAPGISYLAKMAVWNESDPNNAVTEGYENTIDWVGNATAIMGGIFAIPIDVIAAVQDFWGDGSVADGEPEANQKLDAIRFGFAATKELAPKLIGEESLCSYFGDRFQAAAYETYYRNKNGI